MSDGDEQDLAEAFDPDEIGDDPEGELEYPPEQRLGVERGPDAAVVPEVDERTVPGEEPAPGVGRLVESGGDTDDPGAPDDESEAVAWAEPVEADLSAEEAAMHLTDDPPFDGAP